MYYYVALEDAGKRILIAGAYLTEQEAIDNREAAESWARSIDPWFDFYRSCLVEAAYMFPTAALKAISRKIEIPFVACSNIAAS